MITVEDFTIEKTEGEYGPIWIVSPKVQKGGYSQDVHYVLRADWKMNWPQRGKREKSVHLDVAHGDDPLKSYGGWQGVYVTESMDEAVESLVADLNRNEGLEKIEQEIQHLVMELKEQLDDVQLALNNFARQDIKEVMDNIETAYVALRMHYDETRKEVGL